MTASRTAVYGNPASIAICTAAMSVSSAGAKHGESEDAVAFRLDQRLHKSARFRNRHRAKDGSHGQLGNAIRDAALFRLRFAESDTGQLRVGEHAERNLAAGRHAIATGHVFTHNLEIIE